MTTFLLPTGPNAAGPRKRSLYCTVLADIIRAATDAEDALQTAANLLNGDCKGYFSKYDAHVGETGCHIRATMLIVAFQAMKSDALEIEGQPVPNWICDAISQLSTIRTNAERVCLELTKNRKNPALMKLDPKRDYPERIVSVILDQEITTLGDQSLTAHHPCSGEANWDPKDPKMLLRFLVYCYVLSKYKRFSVTEDGGCCRLATELAAEESRRLSAPYWDTRNEDYTLPKSARILAELTSLQCWLSKVSCDWLQTVSYSAPPEAVHPRVLRMSFQESKKGIVSAACFPTFLLLRALWAESFGTIILLDRHFCSQGGSS